MKQALIVVLLLLPANAFAAEPIIRLPLDGERIGAQNTDLCPSEKPCRRAHAEGWVPDDLIGIFAVEPLNASPTVWIQPFESVAGGDVRATIISAIRRRERRSTTGSISSPARPS